MRTEDNPITTAQPYYKLRVQTPLDAPATKCSGLPDWIRSGPCSFQKSKQLYKKTNLYSGHKTEILNYFC